MGRGALVFKGDSPKKKSKKKKHSSKRKEPTVAVVQQQSAAAAAVLPPVVRPQKVPQQQQQIPTMKQATGKITTSGTVVTGHGTSFDKEINQGDALIIMRGEEQEMRIVTMRLSNHSCAISSSFSENAKLPTSFFIIEKPRNRELERLQKQQEALQEQHETERVAFGTYANNDELVYREKTEHGNYRIQRVKVDSGKTTRGDLLEMRTKKKADKYC